MEHSRTCTGGCGGDYLQGPCRSRQSSGHGTKYGMGLGNDRGRRGVFQHCHPRPENHRGGIHLQGDLSSARSLSTATETAFRQTTRSAPKRHPDGGGQTEQCHNEPGIPGVVLYLEDGTRVITDQHGKFSIPGVAPGTHVLRVDTSSLPEGVELTASSGRSMGDGTSQFISIGYGSLFKANFTARMREGGRFHRTARFKNRRILKTGLAQRAHRAVPAPRLRSAQAPEPVERQGRFLTDTPAAARREGGAFGRESRSSHHTSP